MFWRNEEEGEARERWQTHSLRNLVDHFVLLCKKENEKASSHFRIEIRRWDHIQPLLHTIFAHRSNQVLFFTKLTDAHDLWSLLRKTWCKRQKMERRSKWRTVVGLQAKGNWASVLPGSACLAAREMCYACVCVVLVYAYCVCAIHIHTRTFTYTHTHSQRDSVQFV